MKFVRTLARVALCTSLSATGAHAQAPTEPVEEGRFRLGDSSVSITPGAAVVYASDSNIIRTVDGEAGTEYYVVPQVEGWVGRGRIRLYFVSAMEYGEQTTRGSQFNHFNMARLSSDGPRVSFAAQASHRDHFAPPTDYVGFELGLKSRRLEDNLEGSMTLTRGRLDLSAIGRYGRMRYAADAVYDDVSLQESLNRNFSSLEAVAALSLTPMSSIVVSGGPTFDRFLNAPERDGNGYRVFVGGQFEPRALVSGRALVGFMTYETLLTGKTYSGPTYIVGLTTSKGPVLFDVTGNRIIDFSFDPSQGFYVSTYIDTYIGVRASSGWDLAARGTFGTLSPQGFLTEQGPSQPAWTVRAALMRRLIQMSRIGVEVEQYGNGGEGGFRGTRVMGFLTFGSDRLQKLDRPLPGAF